MPKRILGLQHVALAAALVVGTLHIDAQAASAVRYAITELSLVSGYQSNDAYAINDLGQVAGVTWKTDGSVRVTRWGADGQASILGGGWPWAYGEALNNAGVVVGTAYAGEQYAARWSGTEEKFLTAITCCDPTGSAQGINDHGTVVGWVDNRAVAWDSKGAPTLLPNLSRRQGSFAKAINNAGLIVGASLTTGGALHAVVWNGSSMVDLGVAAGYADSTASSINEAGAVVGGSTRNSFEVGHATLWRNGEIIDLGSLNGGLDSSMAYDINSLGQAVGISGNKLREPLNDDDQAVIWLDGESGPIALSSLIDDADPLKAVSRLYRATGINDAGIIVGYGLINGQQRGYLLTPLASVPEAGSVLSALAGMLTLGLAAGLRRKRV